MPPLVAPLVALVFGILASPCLDLSWLWPSMGMSLLLGAVRPQCFLLTAFLLGALLTSQNEARPPSIVDDGYPQRVVAMLEGGPKYRAPGYYIDVELESVGGHEWWGRARLSFFPGEEALEHMFRSLGLGSGDKVEVLVRLLPPRVYLNPGGFDYRRYLRRRGIYWTGTIRNPRLIQVREKGWHGADQLRDWVTFRVGNHFSENPTAQALVLGMVLGQQRRLSSEDTRKFQAAGLTHLLVVSGFNLAVVGGFALWLGRRISFGRHQRKAALLFALLAVWSYTLLVEGHSPVIRATLMATLMLTGLLLDRGYSIGNALSAAAIGILLVDPLAIWDPSFQLTFLAVLGILLLAVRLIHWTLARITLGLRHFRNADWDPRLPVEVADWRVSRRLWCELHGYPLWFVTLPWTIGLILAESLLIAFSVQSLLLPLMAESYHRIAPVALPLNVIGALVAAVITPAGLALVGLPFPIGKVLAGLMESLLRLFIFVVDWGLALPGASLRVPSPPNWVWVLYGTVLLGLALSLGRHSKAGCVTCFLLQFALILVVVLGNFAPPPPGAPVLTFLDVGQGDSILIELPEGKRIVVDGGGFVSGASPSETDRASFSIGEDVVSPYIFSRGIRRLDALVLTHAHHDHMDGLFDLIRNFAVGEVWLGQNALTPRYRELLETIDAHGIPIRWLAAGDTIGPFRVWNPPRNHLPGREVDNDDSLVLMLESNGASALLTGDLERDLPGLPAWVDLLKVPHHGGRDTRLRVRARLPVISVGANNRFGHPDPSRLPALRTDISGAIQVTLEPGHLSVSFPGL